MGGLGQQSFDAHREPPDIVLALVLALALKRKARTAGAGVSTEMLWGQLNMVGGWLVLRWLGDDWH